MVNALLLMMTVLQVNNALLVVPYITNELIVNNAVLLSLVFIFFIAMELKEQGACGHNGVWPRPGMPHREWMGPNAEYRIGVIRRARALLHTASMLPATVASACES